MLQGKWGVYYIIEEVMLPERFRRHKDDRPMQEFPDVEMKEFVHLLKRTKKFWDPVQGRKGIDGYQHGLQTATRARKDYEQNPQDFEGFTEAQIVFWALAHDAGRLLGNKNHARTSAEIMRGRIPDILVEAASEHSKFQVDLILGTHKSDQFKDEPWFPLAKRLETWDADSFDPKYPTLKLRHFKPYLREIYGVESKWEKVQSAVKNFRGKK